MTAAAPPDSVDLVLTVSLVLRRCRERWLDDVFSGYQRLPDGRARFSWGVTGQLAAAQRRTVADHDDLDTCSIGRRVVGAGGAGRMPFRDSRGRIL